MIRHPPQAGHKKRGPPKRASLPSISSMSGALLRGRSRRSSSGLLLVVLFGMHSGLRIRGRGGRTGGRIGSHSHDRTGQHNQSKSRNEFANHESSPLRNISTLATNGIKSILTKPLMATERSSKAFAVITTLHGSESLHERLGTAISSLLIRSKNGKSPILHGMYAGTLQQNRA